MMIAKEIPQVNGKNLEIADVNGPNGVFEIAFSGSRKEGEHGYFYRDLNYSFFFYIEFIYASKNTASISGIDVCGASKEAWSSEKFKINSESEKTLKENIEFFFRNRHPIFPSKPGDESTAALSVTFSWRVAQ